VHQIPSTNILKLGVHGQKENVKWEMFDDEQRRMTEERHNKSSLMNNAKQNLQVAGEPI
jgi:hypothetical protein